VKHKQQREQQRTCAKRAASQSTRAQPGRISPRTWQQSYRGKSGVSFPQTWRDIHTSSAHMNTVAWGSLWVVNGSICRRAAAPTGGGHVPFPEHDSGYLLRSRHHFWLEVMFGKCTTFKLMLRGNTRNNGEGMPRAWPKRIDRRVVNQRPSRNSAKNTAVAAYMLSIGVGAFVRCAGLAWPAVNRWKAYQYCSWRG